MFGTTGANNTLNIFDGLTLDTSINYGTTSGRYWVSPKDTYPHMAATYIPSTSGNVYIEVSGEANDHTNYGTNSEEISYRTTNGYNGNIYV